MEKLGTGSGTMIKHLARLFGWLVLLALAILILIFIHDKILEQDKLDRNPILRSSYWDGGYFKFDTETVLAELEQGNTNVFTPLLVEQPPDEASDKPIYWKQADFLRVASAVGQILWGDPMNLTDWNMYSIHLEGSCKDGLGFVYAVITYFKEIDKDRYMTRIIEIYPAYSWVGWGDGNVYRIPVFHKWNSVDLPGAKINADDAFRIASEDAKVRFELQNNCFVIMSTLQLGDNHFWYLEFFGAPEDIYYKVNLDTGDYTMRSTKKLNFQSFKRSVWTRFRHILLCCFFLQTARWIWYRMNFIRICM